MREVGFLIWAVVVFAGVVSSIVQSARKRAAMNATSGTPLPASGQRLAEMRRLAQTISVQFDKGGSAVAPGRPAATTPRPAGQPRAPALSAASAPVPAQAAGAYQPELSKQPPAWPSGTVERPAHRALERLFRDRHALAGAVIAAEVIGKPLALRNE